MADQDLTFESFSGPNDSGESVLRAAIGLALSERAAPKILLSSRDCTFLKRPGIGCQSRMLRTAHRVIGLRCSLA